MLNMPSISVIVPAYNVEKYLAECLESILNQTFEDLEIICVNDGSTDSTLEIFNGYAEKDSRIKVISQENRGLSGARNTGLKNAAGKYVYFIDSDDYLEFDALQKLYDMSEKNDLDMVLFKLINIDDETKERYPTKYYDMKYMVEYAGEVFSHSDIPKYVYRIPVSIPGKFFKRDLIRDMEFVEGMIFEDNAFFVEALFKAKRVSFLDEYLYIRRVRQDSITTSSKNFTDYITVSNLLIDITKDYGLYDEYKPQLFNKTITNTHLRFDQVSGEDRDIFFAEMKRDYLSKKDEYDADEAFQNSPERLREIFYSAIESKNAREFDLSIKYFDLNKSHAKASKTIKKLSDENQHLKSENEKLIKENEELKKINEDALNSTSWKVTKPLRYLGDAVKK